MEIRQLRSFIAVADTLNFSAAADSLYMTQSALSRQIMALEKELGMALLKRSTRKVELTEAGQVLRHSAKDIISRWEKIEPELKNQVKPEHQSMNLTIGCDDRALLEPTRRVAVMETFYRLRRKYRGIRILFQKSGYQELIQGLIDGTLDCVFTLDRVMDHREEIASAAISHEKMALIFRSANAHSVKECCKIIENRGLILVDKDSQGLYHILQILNELSVAPQLRFCESAEDMTMTVETGESAAIIPYSVAQRLQNPNLQLIPLPGQQSKLDFSLLWNKSQTSLILPELLESLMETFKGEEG